VVKRGVRWRAGRELLEDLPLSSRIPSGGLGSVRPKPLAIILSSLFQHGLPPLLRSGREIKRKLYLL